MGCDIHLHTEVKIKGKWHHYAERNVERCYRLFAKMANVRNYEEYGITPISDPRGMPEDASETTKFFCEEYGADGHSHSWLDAKEIDELYRFINDDLKLVGGRIKQSGWWPEENFGYFFGNTWAGWNRYQKYQEHLKEMGVEDVRFVFWFDN